MQEVFRPQPIFPLKAQRARKREKKKGRREPFAKSCRDLALRPGWTSGSLMPVRQLPHAPPSAPPVPAWKELTVTQRSVWDQSADGTGGGGGFWQKLLQHPGWEASGRK